jgi:hypothetical protein
LLQPGPGDIIGSDPLPPERSIGKSCSFREEPAAASLAAARDPAVPTRCAELVVKRSAARTHRSAVPPALRLQADEAVD